jgi:thioredoxin reductase (NADPH)
MSVLIRTDAARASAKTLRALLNEDDPTLFPKLTDEQLGLLTPLGQIRPTEVGEVLFREGDTTYDVMILLEGRVAVVLGSGESERELVIHRPRDLMIVHATGVVREAGSILSVPAQEFRALLGRELVFGDFVLQMLFRRRQAIERLVMGIQIVGSRFDRDTHRLREFAARNRVLHNWLDSDSVHGKRLVDEPSIDAFSGPIVFLEGGTCLRNPTNVELARAIGLPQGSVSAEKACDLVIVGAGPAGLAASVYGASGGMRTAMIDAVAIGGQAATSARIENYLGFPAGISGAELAERAKIQAEKFNVYIMVPRCAVGLTEREGFHVVTLDDGDELFARSVILALGVQYRRLPIPRIADYEGLGVAYAVDSAREQLRSGDAAASSKPSPASQRV